MGGKEDYKNWYERNKEKVRAQKAAKMREYRAANPEKHRQISRDCKARLREKVFSLYGRECVLCGFTDIRALTLDHIKRNGSRERRELGERGVYQRAVGEHLPDDYRILCMNCQFISRDSREWWLKHGND